MNSEYSGTNLPSPAPKNQPRPLATTVRRPADGRIPLTVDATQSGLPDGTPVRLYVVGEVQTALETTFYRLDSEGTPHAMSPSDNARKAGTFPGSEALSPKAVAALTANYPLDWADYSIAGSLTNPVSLDLARINPANCPGLGTGTAAFSGRVYISVGVPTLPFTAVSKGYTAPVPTGGPGEFTLFDWIEFSFDSERNFNGNTTQVDQFGFALSLEGGGGVQGKLKQPRAAVMDAFGSTLPAPFGGGVLQVAVPGDAAAAYPEATKFLRLIAPKTITATPAYTGPLQSHFDAVIRAAYTRWQSTPLVTHDTATGFFTGIVPTSGSHEGVLTFFAGQFATLAELETKNPPVAFVLTGSSPQTNVILTSDVWQCVNTLATGGDAQKNVGKMLAAAFNRGVISDFLDDSTCEQNAASFYPAGAASNLWSQRFHQFSENGLAYGFPYDDVCNQNPSISIQNTAGVTIVVAPFGGA